MKVADDIKQRTRDLAIVIAIDPELVEIGLDNYAHRHKIDIPQTSSWDYNFLYRDLSDHGTTLFEKDSIVKWRRTGQR